jgi:transketolase
LTQAKAAGAPALIACKTHIALGSSAQDTSKGHGALTDAKLIADTKAAYGWAEAPFGIPAAVKARWEGFGARGAAARAAWEAHLATLPQGRQDLVARIFAGDAPKGLKKAIHPFGQRKGADGGEPRDV